jgi:hypothetical protein
MVGWTETYRAFTGALHTWYRSCSSLDSHEVKCKAQFVLQNDPVKTVCATMFIVSVIQHIKIADLSQSGLSLSADGPGDDMMDIHDVDHIPDGTDLGDTPRLSRAEERSLARDSTAGFAGAYNSK